MTENPASRQQPTRPVNTRRDARGRTLPTVYSSLTIRVPSSVEQAAAMWAATQIGTEAVVRGDLDERTAGALTAFLLRIGQGTGQVYGDA